MDLPLPDGPHPGHRHRRRRAQAVPLPRPLAGAPRPPRSSRRMLDFARALPAAAPAGARDLADDGFRRERLLGCAVRLLDRGFFRIGSEDYAEENETYGLATMRKEPRDRRRRRGGVRLRGQGRASTVQRIDDDDVAEVVKAMKARRGGARSCWPTRAGARWVDVKSADINEYVKEAAGGDFARRTSAPGTPRSWPRWRWALGRGGEAPRPRTSAPSSARSRRSPATWATRRRSAARPTSTRACSTASTAGSQSAGALPDLLDPRPTGPSMQGGRGGRAGPDRRRQVGRRRGAGPRDLGPAGVVELIQRPPQQARYVHLRHTDLLGYL